MEIKKHYASLSEAIREGAKLRPQTVGHYFNDGGSCALGAALEACFGQSELCCVPRLWELFSYMEDHFVPCPAGCVSFDAEIEGMIPHLNDDHEWTREAIADWLETEEEKLGYVHIVETEALKQEEGFYPSTSQAQSGVSK